MSVLLLRLAAPMQSWGDSSRFTRRETRPEPTKSGVLGLIAAAQGRRRTDPLEDLAHLRFGVRVDQPGRLVRDFHTAHDREGRSMPLSYRFYLGDAAFLAAVEAERGLLEGVEDALRKPTFPLYLGRRSCPPVGPVSIGLRDGDLRDVLLTEPWHAAPWHQRRVGAAAVDLEVVRDARSADEMGEVVRDEPVSFDPVRREYGWRTVVREMAVAIPNPRADPAGASRRSGAHDPMALLGGA